MGKWAARIMALLILLAFALVLAQLHKQLVMLQQQQQQSKSAR